MARSLANDNDQSNLENRESRRRLVVGIDGSQRAQEALAWAMEEADCHRYDIEIVSSWYLPQYDWADVRPPPPDPRVEMAARTRALVVQAAADVSAALPDIAVSEMAVEGNAASVLIELSKDADLLVIGSRGNGGFKGLVLGSVSQQCVSHAQCPVVVVRGTRHGIR